MFPYFAKYARYEWSPTEGEIALSIAAEAAHRMDLPFVVIDLAQRLDGSWTVIEINDAQECGYTGVRPLPLWQRMVEVERARMEK